jgi:hypothetical protein
VWINDKKNGWGRAKVEDEGETQTNDADITGQGCSKATVTPELLKSTCSVAGQYYDLNRMWAYTKGHETSLITWTVLQSFAFWLSEILQ